MSIQSVKGTRDFYPQDLALRNWFSEHIRQTCLLYGYEEWDGPMLEPFELYAAKSGDELLNEQAFVIEDRGGRKIVLRPELTPSLARMIAQKQHELPKPIRWFSIGPMWRYEQPQRGRAREFWQWNCDILGVLSPFADAEVIAVAIRFLTSLRLTDQDFIIKINDRKWFEGKLADLSVASSLFPKILRAVDRIDKMDEKAWKEHVISTGLDQKTTNDLFSMLTAQNKSMASLALNPNLQMVVETLANMGLQNFIEIDASVVRGLDYYTSTVFEIRDRKGALRAIGGGGRYSNLVEQVGGQPIEAVGFALGDMPLEELLHEAGKYPKRAEKAPTVLVSVFSNSLFQQSLRLAEELRKNNIATSLYIPQTEQDYDLHKQLKYADQKSIPYVLLLGENEAKDKTVTVKNMANGNQETIDQTKLLDYLKQP